MDRARLATLGLQHMRSAPRFRNLRGRPQLRRQCVGSLLLKPCKAERVCREYPVTFELGDELYEGVIDLAWFDGTRWTVIDYKTGSADEPRTGGRW